MTTLTLQRLAEIEAAAAKATPGPWTTTDCSNGGALLMRGGPKFIQTHLQIVPIEDAAHIALCDPQTVAALCQVVRAAVKRSKLVNAPIEPGDSGYIEWVVTVNEAANELASTLRAAGLLE